MTVALLMLLPFSPIILVAAVFGFASKNESD